MRAAVCSCAAPAVGVVPRAPRRQAAALTAAAPKPLVGQQPPVQQRHVGKAAVAQRQLVRQPQPVLQRHVAAGAAPKEPEGEEPGRGEAAAPQYREGTAEEERASPTAWVERGSAEEPRMVREDELLRGVERGSAEEPRMVREDELLRGAGAQVAGGGVADEPERVAAAPAPPSGAASPSQMFAISEDALLTVVEKAMDAKLRTTVKEVVQEELAPLRTTVKEVVQEELAPMRQQLTALEELKPLRQQVTALARATGANAETAARATKAVRNLKGYWATLTMRDAHHLLEWMAAGGHPAELDAVLDKVLAGHRGYFKLRQLVLRRLTAEVPEIRSLANQFGQCGNAGWWHEERLRLAKLEALLRQQADASPQQQPEDEGGDARWWAPFVSTLQAYCSAADKEGGDQPPGGDGLRRFLQKPRRDARSPVVMMVAALAAGQLRTSIQFSCAPRLAVHGSTATAETMVIKSSLKGLSEARQQLLEAGQVMVWLPRVANPGLLNGRQLQLRGVIAVQGHMAASQWWEVARELKVTSCGLTTTLKPEVEVF